MLDSDRQLIETVMDAMCGSLDAERSKRIFMGLWEKLPEERKAEKRVILKKFAEAGEYNTKPTKED